MSAEAAQLEQQEEHHREGVDITPDKTVDQIREEISALISTLNGLHKKRTKLLNSNFLMLMGSLMESEGDFLKKREPDEEEIAGIFRQIDGLTDQAKSEFVRLREVTRGHQSNRDEKNSVTTRLRLRVEDIGNEVKNLQSFFENVRMIIQNSAEILNGEDVDQEVAKTGRVINRWIKEAEEVLA